MAAASGEIINTNHPGLTLAQYSMPRVIAPNTSDVPKSGCTNTNDQGTAAIANTLTTPNSVVARVSRSCAARVMINPTLANSDGCTLKPKIVNHRWAPNPDVPTKITATNDKLTMA